MARNLQLEAFKAHLDSITEGFSKTEKHFLGELISLSAHTNQPFELDAALDSLPEGIRRNAVASALEKHLKEYPAIDIPKREHVTR